MDEWIKQVHHKGADTLGVAYTETERRWWGLGWGSGLVYWVQFQVGKRLKSPTYYHYVGHLQMVNRVNFVLYIFYHNLKK